MLEIRFHGRGGQGAVVAAEILANALLHEGKYSQNFPDFGIERQGAPVTAFLRRDEAKILIRSKIYYPDFVVVLDPSLIKSVNAIQGLKENGWLLINSPKTPAEFQNLGVGNIATVDAKGIALKYKIGTATRPIVNTVILGAMIKILEIIGPGISFESLIKAIEEIFEKKFGGKALKDNIEGAREAYETVKILSVLAETPVDKETKLQKIKGRVIENKKYLPYIAVSQETTLGNKTGSWRTQRPVYQRGISPCQAHCLSLQDIPRWLQALKNGKLEAAYRIILESNPFPSLTGRVCPHPCEKACNRGQFDEPLAINLLEKFLGDWGLKNVSLELPAISQDEKIAIIGSGPCGLSCAYYLRQKGYKVTIFESSSLIGGIPAHGIPDFRLPGEVLEKEIEKKIAVSGIDLITRTIVDKTIFDCLFEAFDAIFVATGLSKSRRLAIEGEEILGVFPGLEFLKKVKLRERVQLGQKVVVVGGGNTAIDAARTARRLGSEVSIFYRRTRAEMPAIEDEIGKAEKEGIKIEELVSPVKIISRLGKVDLLECQRMKLGEIDESGRKRPIPIEGSNFSVKTDNIIVAIGEEKDDSFLPEDWQSQEKIFVGGDFENGAGTVAAAIRSGREKAEEIDRRFRGKTKEDKTEKLEVVKYEDLNKNYFSHQLRVRDLGSISPELLAQSEAKRCFSCGYCNLCGNCYKFCPDLAVRKQGENYRINYDYCKGCGICAAECPTRSIILKLEEGND